MQNRPNTGLFISAQDSLHLGTTHLSRAWGSSLLAVYFEKLKELYQKVVIIEIFKWHPFVLTLPRPATTKLKPLTIHF